MRGPQCDETNSVIVAFVSSIICVGDIGAGKFVFMDGLYGLSARRCGRFSGPYDFTQAAILVFISETTSSNTCVRSHITHPEGRIAPAPLHDRVTPRFP